MYCDRCGRGTWACVCDLTFAEKLRGVQFSTENFETRAKRNYYDRTAITPIFGEDSREEYMADTQGRGTMTLQQVRDPRTNPADIDFYLSPETETWGDDDG